MNGRSTPVRLGEIANDQLDALQKKFGLSKRKLAEQAIMEAHERWPAEGLHMPGTDTTDPRPRRGERAA